MLFGVCLMNGRYPLVSFLVLWFVLDWFTRGSETDSGVVIISSAIWSLTTVATLGYGLLWGMSTLVMSVPGFVGLGTVLSPVLYLGYIVIFK